MVAIRPLRPEDIPAVVALRQRSFTHSAQPTTAEAERYFQQIFFDSPWVDPELPSLVYEDVCGISGFVGVLARRMCYRGEALRVAVTTQFAVAAASRGIAGVLLVKRIFGGPQDLTLSDVVNEPTRKVWERLGGVTLPMYSLHWTHSLAPVTCSAMQVPGNVVWRAARRASRPLLRVGDWMATRSARASDRRLPPGRTLAPDEFEAGLRAFGDLDAGGGGIKGRYTRSELLWLLTQLSQKFGPALHVVGVPNESGGFRGWYAYTGGGRSAGEVIHIAATAGEYPVVLAHLFAHARARGLTAIRGRFEPRHAREWGERASVDRDGPWITVHSKRPELLMALSHPDSQLSRLDGEWWLNF